jgi:hypothetical protein
MAIIAGTKVNDRTNAAARAMMTVSAAEGQERDINENDDRLAIDGRPDHLLRGLDYRAKALFLGEGGTLALASVRRSFSADPPPALSRRFELAWPTFWGGSIQGHRFQCPRIARFNISP